MKKRLLEAGWFIGLYALSLVAMAILTQALRWLIKLGS